MCTPDQQQALQREDRERSLQEEAMSGVLRVATSNKGPVKGRGWHILVAHIAGPLHLNNSPGESIEDAPQ